MRPPFWLAGLALFWSGCASTEVDRVRIYNDEGVHLFEQGDYLTARECFQSALALAPEDAGLLFNIGKCYYSQGNVARAEEIYRECLSREPNHARCRHALTVLLVNTNRRKEAVYMIESWLAKEPKLADPYTEDGWLWRQAGDLPQAQARLQQALDRDPHNLRALTELGLVYEDLGLSERALVLYERALAIDPRQPNLVQRINRLEAQKIGRPKP
jgi:tetratricopeptide (TPR) repeat protein